MLKSHSNDKDVPAENQFRDSKSWYANADKSEKDFQYAHARQFCGNDPYDAFPPQA
ncbi:MAG TPA: hypothetical protein VIU45_01150 [Chitinophagaceae bacterium]